MVPSSMSRTSAATLVFAVMTGGPAIVGGAMEGGATAGGTVRVGTCAAGEGKVGGFGPTICGWATAAGVVVGGVAPAGVGRGTGVTTVVLMTGALVATTAARGVTLVGTEP